MTQEQPRESGIGFFISLAVLAAAGAVFGYSLIVSADRVTWNVTRAAGIVAYLFLGISSVSGLLVSSRLIMNLVKPAALLDADKASSFLGIAALAVHGAVLLFDKVVPYSLVQVLVPFTSDYRPLAVSLGIASGYIAVGITVSFYIRKQIGGQRVWRMLHYSAFAAFFLSSLHGILAGTDSGTIWMLVMYLLSIGAVAFLTLVRVLGGRAKPAGARDRAPAYRNGLARPG